MIPEHHEPERDREHAADAEAERKRLEERRKRHDARLDEGLEETFPASDPVSVRHIT
jgi:hypothetical protein